MRHIFKTSLSLLFFAGAVSTFVGCGATNTSQTAVPGTPQTGDTAWQYQPTISEPLKAKATKDADVQLGDIEKNKVTITLPKGSFDEDTDIQLTNPTELPKFNGHEINTIGAPIDISAGKPVRLNEGAVVSFAFDPLSLPQGATSSELRVAYFDGQGWDYIKPTSVDMNAGRITFTTYHFSLLGLTQIKEKTVLTEKWIHSKTLDKELKKNINKVSDAIANQVIELTLEKMGISDKSIKGTILSEILKDDGYKKIIEAGQSGNVEDLTQKIVLLAGKKIAAGAPASVLKTALGKLAGSPLDIAAAGKAAGFIAGGQYTEAGKVIGEQIAGKFVVATAGKIAIEVVNGQIESWKGAEVEAAYKAYKDGANGTFWGYNNDKGDFGAVWDQMRGIRRQLELEAIKKQNAVRKESGLKPLTEEQSEMAREGVRQSFQNQFEKRVAAEDRMKKEEDSLRLLVKTFEEANFFDPTLGPEGLDKGLDYDTKLDVLYHFTDKIMADTGRFELSETNGLVMDSKISVDDIAQAARLWFSRPDGPMKYKQFLFDRFNIPMWPDLKLLGGEWKSGNMHINDVIVPPDAKEKIAASKDKTLEGCDLSIDLTKLKGKDVPISLNLTPTSESGGTMVINLDKKPQTMPFSYENGVIKAETTINGAAVSIEWAVSEQGAQYGINGSFNMNYGNGIIQMFTTITASKSKPAPPVPAK